jgi:hypothetical protein
MKIEIDREKLAKALQEQREKVRSVATVRYTPSIAGSKSTDIFIDLPPATTFEQAEKNLGDTGSD